MEIVQSWEDHNTNIYAIVSHSKQDQQTYNTKEYEAMYMIDSELNSFGGAVGYGVADSDTIEEVQEFLLKGISLQDTNPDIWLEMVKVQNL